MVSLSGAVGVAQKDATIGCHPPCRRVGRTWPCEFERSSPLSSVAWQNQTLFAGHAWRNRNGCTCMA